MDTSGTAMATSTADAIQTGQAERKVGMKSFGITHKPPAQTVQTLMGK
jgi:hypothetical protein